MSDPDPLSSLQGEGTRAMSQTQDSFPLKFLHLSSWRDVDDLLQSPDNISQLQRLLTLLFLDGVLARSVYQSLEVAEETQRIKAQRGNPTLAALSEQLAGREPTGALEASVTKKDLAGRLAAQLIEAVTEKLKQYYPPSNKKSADVLLRRYPARAGSFLDQAIGYLYDLCDEESKRAPQASLATAFDNILPALKKWPEVDMRGRPQHGTTSQLTYLALFEDTMKALKGLSRRPHNGYEEKQRRAFLDQALHVVPSAPGRGGSKFFHPQTKEIFFEIPDAVFESELSRWVKKLSRKEIALEITAAVVTRTGVHLTANTLGRLLPKLRTRTRHQ